MFIDSHAHLMFKDFKKDLDDVIKRLKEAEVEKVVNVGFDVESSDQAVEMAKNYEDFYACVGLHPYDAALLKDDLMEGWSELISENKKIVGIGESGLDYFKAKVPKDVQKKSFEAHLKLGQETGLPVIVHNRDADQDCLEIINRVFEEGDKVDVVFHCYGSSLEFARKLWQQGIYTSFTGIITFPNAKELREVVKEVPMDLFMIETDCPYLAPQAHRGDRNEPAYVVEVAKEIAEVKGLSLEEVAEKSIQNTLRFFSRMA